LPRLNATRKLSFEGVWGRARLDFRASWRITLLRRPSTILPTTSLRFIAHSAYHQRRWLELTDRLWSVEDLAGPRGSPRAAEGGKSGIRLGSFYVCERICRAWHFGTMRHLAVLFAKQRKCRFYQRFYGPRFSPKPLFIRLAGGVWIAASLWIFWPKFPK
jgi:hypothetical protein